MNCDDLRVRLDSDEHAADVALSPEMRAHLEDCADCRLFRDRLAAILEPRSALSPEIQPPRDLWSGIASRLDEEDEPQIRQLSISKLVPLAAAAAFAVVVIASLFERPLREDPPAAPIALRTSEADPISAPAMLPVTSVEIGFVQTRAALMKLVEARKTGIPDERVAELERTLETIGSAIRDIHAALESDPNNRFLLLKLSDARRRELRILQQAIS